MLCNLINLTCSHGYRSVIPINRGCALGFFKAEIGDHACAPCDGDRFYVNATSCGVCNEDESSSADFLACVCNAPLVV